jgi:putrescine---pyruvate transaminase
VGASNEPAIMLAERLVGLAAGGLDAVFFTSGGADANESAFKTARFHRKASGKPDKVKVIARSQAYHGLTLQTMSATGMGEGYWNVFEPRPGVRPRAVSACLPLSGCAPR